jgi:hypothetical protein
MFVRTLSICMLLYCAFPALGQGVVPAVTSVSPAAGQAGAQVTVSGSGFGSVQGTGALWLGSAPGAVVSWSDTQIVATVAAGSFSGNARVLQSGVWSNALPFAVDALQVASIDPVSGPAGTTVTFTGSGFGASQGPGTAWLGSAEAQVVSWSDTQVVAVVADSAVTGVARIRQDDAWSNAKQFSVTGTDAPAATLAPHLLNMTVGDTHAIQALDSGSHSVTGLTWNSSDANVVSLSNDDPPVLTAVSAGHVTVTAGAAPTASSSRS